MTRQSWIYPSDGSPPVPKADYHPRPRENGVMIVPDLPDFISPIDGLAYSGRAGLREHCKRHDVVPNAELKGLPVLTSISDTRSSEQKKQSAEHRKQVLIQQVSKHYR